MSSSWPTPPAYPPRRSRSRSPYRGSYPLRPQYPDTAYGDPYRSDWEAYDRDRAWASYERERAAFDYGRRGRSRSPGLDEAGRKRRRSLSPYDSRHDPRPRYDEYEHGRHSGRSPPRGSYPYGSRHGPPDPRTLDYPASLKQYAEWFRYNYPQEAQQEDAADRAAEMEAGDGSKPRNGIKTRWEQYKKEFAAQQLSRMFDHHRKSPWFQEKYNPEEEFVNLRNRTRQKGWRGRVHVFLDALETGEFDADAKNPQFEQESSSAAKEQVNSGDANGAEDVKPAIKEEDEQLEADATENDGPNGDTNGKGGVDIADLKRVGSSDEISVPPEGNQVMIRTIPPDIGRIKLEESLEQISGFVYLALGDPLQKRNFYRAGWIKFRDDVDMALVMTDLTDRKIEGFKLHVTHLLKPFSNRIRYAPEVASRPDRLEKDLTNVRALAALLEAEYTQLRLTKIPPRGAARKPVEGEEGRAGDDKGDGDTNGDTKTEPTDIPMTDTEHSIDDEDPEPRESGCAAVERHAEKLLAEVVDSGALDMSDEKAVQMKKTQITLDLYLAYLRSAFHTCYYCALVTDHVEELQRKCIKHVRKPLSKMLLDEYLATAAAELQKNAETDGEGALKKEDEDGDGEKEQEQEQEKSAPKTKQSEVRDWKRNDERWLEWLDSKVALLINKDGVNPKDYGGKSYDEEVAKAVEPHIKQEDEGKFRCKTCQKLFKATSFVEKHVANKHPEHVESALQDLPFFNNFALDPHRIQPFTHPPTQTATNQPPTMQGYGAYPPDYGRGAPYHGGAYPPPYPGGAYYDPYAYAYGGYPRGRDDGRAGRLSDRIGSYASGYDPSSEPAVPLPAGVGLPQKPVAATLEPGPGPRKAGRPSGPPPPPPPDAKEDPRAAAGRKISYHDMDLVAEGDVELNY